MRLSPMALRFMPCETTGKCLLPQCQLWCCLEYHRDEGELHFQFFTLFRQQLWNRDMPKTCLPSQNTAWSLELQKVFQLCECVNVNTVFILGVMEAEWEHKIHSSLWAGKRAWILESSVERVNDNNRFWGCCCVFCAGFTEEGTIERASSCYWTEPPLPEAFHRVSRAAGHFERQVACPQVFPVGPGLRETAEQH